MGCRSGLGRADRRGAQHRQRGAGPRPHHSARARAARRPIVSSAGKNQLRTLIGTLAIVSLLTAASVGAQQRGQQQPAQPTAAQQQAAQAAAAQAAAQQAAQQLLTGLRAGVNQLRDQERALARERDQRFRAELQRVERQAQEAVTRRNAAEARSNALDRQWNENEQTLAETQALLT